MDTNVLRYFLAIAEFGTISAASRKIHVTQPTLSRQLKDLEAQMGVLLFIRERHHMTLTRAGFVFKARAEQILKLVTLMTEEVQNDADEITGTLNIGCIESSVSKTITLQIEQFHEKFPLVKINFSELDGNDIKDGIDQGVLDVGVVLKPAEVIKYNIYELPIADHWGVILPKDFSQRQLKAISAKTLKELPLILPKSELIQRALMADIGIEMDDLNIFGTQNLVTNSLSLCREKVAYPLCAGGALPDGISDLTFMPLQDVKAISHLMIWPKNRKLTAAMNAFLSIIDKKTVQMYQK